MIKLIEPYFDYKDLEKDFKHIFDSGIFTKGEYNQKLISDLKDFTNCNEVFLTTSATTALYMSLMALSLPKGSKVGVSDFTWPASAYVVIQAGLEPIMVDVERDTFNISKKTLSDLDTEINALIFVDALGNTSNLDEVYDYCKKNDIYLIEDAACAFGTKTSGKNIGEFSDIACASFHPRKLLNSGEGGCIITRDNEVAEILNVQLNVGARLEQNKLFPNFIDMGYNFRLPELQCAMVSHQINQIEEIVGSRQKIYQEYSKELSPLGFVPQKFNENIKPNLQSVVFIVPQNISRDELIRFLKERDIETVLGTYSISSQPFFIERLSIQPLQNSTFLQNNTISLPCYRTLDPSIVIDSIKDFIK